AFSFDGHLYAIGGLNLLPNGFGSITLTALDTVESLLFFPSFGGAAPRAKSPDVVSGDATISTPAATPLAVTPVPGAMVEGSSGHTVLRDQDDGVFAAGILSDSLADSLFAERIR